MADQPNSFPPTTFNGGQPNDKARASVNGQTPNGSSSRWIHPPAVSQQVNHIQNAPNCNRLKSIKMSTIGHERCGPADRNACIWVFLGYYFGIETVCFLLPFVWLHPIWYHKVASQLEMWPTENNIFIHLFTHLFLSGPTRTIILAISTISGPIDGHKVR